MYMYIFRLKSQTKTTPGSSGNSNQGHIIKYTSEKKTKEEEGEKHSGGFSVPFDVNDWT